MASIDLVIGGRHHDLACRDGEEAHLRAIAAMVDAKAGDAARAMGGMSEARQMLFAALMLADELNDAHATIARQAALPAPVPPAPDPAAAILIEQLAERIERLAALIDTVPAERVETPAVSA